MPVSSIRVTEGSGPYLHAWERAVSAVNRREQYVQLGEPALPTFTCSTSGTSVATSGDHILQLMAPASSYVRIHRIFISQAVLASANTAGGIQIIRLTTAGSGGTTRSPVAFDTGDTAGATGQSLPSSKGTEGNVLLFARMYYVQTAPITNVSTWEWHASDRGKPIIIPSGTANGIAVKTTNSVTGAQADVVIEFTETSFL